MTSSLSFDNSTALIPRIVSYNVNSLSYYSDSKRRNLVRTFINDAIQNVDILCLQETNLASTERSALANIKGIASLNNHQMGTAGTAILDSTHLLNHYSGSDVELPASLKGRVQIRRYAPKAPRYSAFQLVNVYLHAGPNFKASTPLLEALLKVDNQLPTFLTGDWNFITRSEDTTSPSYPMPPTPFLNLFQKVLDHFKVSELPHDHHTFYHSSHDPNQARSTRLDRFYLPSEVLNNPLSPPSASIYHHRSNYSHKNAPHKTWFSDHLPVLPMPRRQ